MKKVPCKEIHYSHATITIPHQCACPEKNMSMYIILYSALTALWSTTDLEYFENSWLFFLVAICTVSQYGKLLWGNRTQREKNSLRKKSVREQCSYVNLRWWKTTHVHERMCVCRYVGINALHIFTQYPWHHCIYSARPLNGWQHKHPNWEIWHSLC